MNLPAAVVLAVLGPAGRLAAQETRKPPIPAPPMIASTAPIAADVPPAAAPAGPIQLAAADLVWKEGPSTLPAGTKVAVLEGDPKQPGLFTMRIKLPAGARIQPHFHPSDERVTVISGSVSVGFGGVFNAAKGKLFKAGAFYVTPSGAPHFVWTEGGAVLQLNNMGPWSMHFPGAAPTPKTP